MVLRAFALPYVREVMPAIEVIVATSPFRHMMTPGGFTMSVALTNCGALGWTTDRRGYRYTGVDPDTNEPWPAMPEGVRPVGARGCEGGRLRSFRARCLPGQSLHAGCAAFTTSGQERARLRRAHRVCVTGHAGHLPFGGHARTDPSVKVPLIHGDVVVWGGPDRLRYHGVMPLRTSPMHCLEASASISLSEKLDDSRIQSQETGFLLVATSLEWLK